MTHDSARIDAPAGRHAGEPDAADGRKRRRRVSGRVRALLAGGLVLGVGATVTLAAWNDSEFATATFQAGAFNLQGSSDGTTFTDHTTAPGAPLGFSVNASSLSPGDVVYAPYAVRLAANTTNAATVTVTAPSTSGTVAGLTYSLIQPSSFGCSASTTGTTLVPAATAVGTVPGTVTFELAPGTPTTSPGTAVNLCFVVTAGAGLTQSQSGSATWQLQAASH
jgi:predicted ribosomally synthesized peptide with SipW-like signal peptide